MSKPEYRYEDLTRETLSKAIRETLSKAIEELRVDVTLSNENFNDLPPIAEAHFLICMSLLQQAENTARLLNYYYMRQM